MSAVEARLRLQKDLARHLRAGHPWVFRKAVEKAPKALAAGAIVDVVEGERFVARGYYDPHSAIAVRILTRESAEEIDAAFWRNRMQRALALRRDLVRGTTGFRVVHGESDGLPGVIADRYDRWIGAEALLGRPEAAPGRDRRGAPGGHGAGVAGPVSGALPLAGIFGRDEIVAATRRETRRRSRGASSGGAEPPERIAIDEHGMKLLVDVRRGQKTGTFLDQRENRHLVRELARGRADALNCFSYTGGFSIAAALGGARRW